MSYFNVNDKLVIIDEKMNYQGMRGTILEVYNSHNKDKSEWEQFVANVLCLVRWDDSFYGDTYISTCHLDKINC